MKNIIETLEDSENLSVFLDLVRTAGMQPMLREQGPFTVFVPTDEAFSRVPEERMDEIRYDADKLFIIVSYHIVPGLLTSENLRSVAAVRSSLRTDIVVRSSDRGITVSSVPIVEAGAFCDGVCRAIASALVPGDRIVTPSRQAKPSHRHLYVPLLSITNPSRTRSSRILLTRPGSVATRAAASSPVTAPSARTRASIFPRTCRSEP